MLRTLSALTVVLAALFAVPALAGATDLPPGFAESTVWTGLGSPTVVRFAPDGRAFVANKAGKIYEFSGPDDTTPTLFADLSSEVFDGWDRGMLGMTLDPHFTTGRPYVYVSYAYDLSPFSPLPDGDDTCPPDPTIEGCTILGRVSRLDASGSEHVLLQGFCQQFVSHSVGSLEFGPDDQLYVSSGDGASYNWADYGQRDNQCGDPPGPAGTPLTPPTAEGGALRSQSFRRPASESAVFNGAILRVDPDTGDASPGNPASDSTDPVRRRIVAYGFRNPFRFTFRPGTGEIWTGDVGWNAWEEIDRTPDLTQVRDYGWPCYEGAARMGSYDAQNVDICENLYSAGTATDPYFTYNHFDQVVPGEDCPTASSAISGVHFYTGDSYPAAYNDALFFADYARNCIWVAFKGANGLPDMSTRQTFASNAGNPVFLTEGPDGAIWYPDVVDGTVRRIFAFDQAPIAKITATPDHGDPPLEVHFDATGFLRPRGRGRHLRVGSRRRRRLRRLDVGQAHVHVHAARHGQRAPARDRSRQSLRDGLADDHGRHAADGDDRLAVVGGAVQRRRQDQLLRLRPGRDRRRAAGFGSELVADPAPLRAHRRQRLPHASGRRFRRRVGQLQRARPRVPVAPGAVADRGRRRTACARRRPCGWTRARSRSRWPATRRGCSCLWTATR